MRRFRIAFLIAAFSAPALPLACSEDAPRASPPAALDGAPGVDVDAVALADASETDDGSAGAFVVVDVPDTPCLLRADGGSTVYPASSGAYIASLAALGTRRLAQRDDGFVVFDADGANASAVSLRPSRAVAPLDETTIAAVTLATPGGVGPSLALYGPNGETKLAPAELAPTPAYGISIAAGGGSGLVVWGGPGGVLARGVIAGGAAGAAFPLAATGDVQGFAASVARKDDETFAVAFSGDSVDGEHNRLSFVPTTTTGRRATGFNLEISSARRKVVALVPRPGKPGWALLVNYGSGLGAHLVLLTEDGRIDGPVLRLVGAGSGYGLAASGDELGVLTLHEAPADAGALPDADASDASSSIAPPYYAAFRPFSSDGAPLGGWVCLGDGLFGPDEPAAILAEPDGYAVGYLRANHDVALVRFDRRGN